MATKKCETEQTLRYWLFPHDNQKKPVIEESLLELLISSYSAHIASITHEYIWHNDPFALHVSMGSAENEYSSSLGPHIFGKMVVGDNIEDEWIVYHILSKLTKDFEGLICRIIDTDGEFPLIEAAQHLPSWVNPDTAEQRVYIRNGLLHLIPHETPISPDIEILPVMSAVSHINNSPSKSSASPAIQNAINDKISGYPSKIREDQHVAHAYVPVGVAGLLTEYPTLIAACVKSFCARDHLDNKNLRVMKHFPPEQRVKTAVRFTKALYAQLLAHPYTPDPKTGWKLPVPTDPSYSSHLLGIKLACGFEILVCSAGGVSPSTPTTEMDSNESTVLDVTQNNPKWMGYKTSLEQKGYFRGELEGSKLYKELERNAQHFFVANVLTSKKGDSDANDLSVGAAVVKLLSKVNADYMHYKSLEQKLTPADDEKWLEITPEALDEFLESKYGTGPYNAPKASSDQDMKNTLSSFFNLSSEVDGVDIPKDLNNTPPQKPSRKKSARKMSDNLVPRKISSLSNASNASEMSSFSNKVNFNVEAFTDAVNNILEFHLPEDEYFDPSGDESSGMSSYEDDDKDISLSRKSSDGSQKSKASSGIDVDMVECMNHLEEELKQTSLRENMGTSHKKPKGKKIPLATIDDEFDDDDDDLTVDNEILQELMKTYNEENGQPGPATTLLGSLGMRPQKN